tara:strand:- start:1409 stop:1930 length:522 start_codon:yes stop_codon:yes gene_type:complete
MDLIKKIAENLNLFFVNKTTGIESKRTDKLIISVINTTFSINNFQDSFSKSNHKKYFSLSNIDYQSTLSKALSILLIDIEKDKALFSKLISKNDFKYTKFQTYNTSLLNISKVLARAFLKNEKVVLNYFISNIKKILKNETNKEVRKKIIPEKSSNKTINLYNSILQKKTCFV